MQFWWNSMKFLQIPDSIALWNGLAVSSKNIGRVLFWPLNGLSSNFGYNPCLYPVSYPSLAFFPFLWKILTSNLCSIMTEDTNFHFRGFYFTLKKKLVILSVHWHTDHQHIPNLTMVNVGLISPGNYEMGFTIKPPNSLVLWSRN